MGVVLGAFWKPLWAPRAALGVFWGSCAHPLGDFLGSSDVLLAVVGCLGGHRDLLEPPWAARVRFPGFSGKFWEAFWLHFELIFMFFALFLGFVF